MCVRASLWHVNQSRQKAQALGFVTPTHTVPAHTEYSEQLSLFIGEFKAQLLLVHARNCPFPIYKEGEWLLSGPYFPHRRISTILPA